MGTRGYDLVGTGYFGPKTEAAVLDLQAKAGLNVVGFIGPKTWAAAWDGSAAPGGGSGAAAPAAYVPADGCILRGGSAHRPGLAGEAVCAGRHRP